MPDRRGPLPEGDPPLRSPQEAPVNAAIGCLIVSSSVALSQAVSAGLRDLGSPSAVVRSVDSEGAVSAALGDRSWDVVVGSDDCAGVPPERLLALLHEQALPTPCVVLASTTDPARGVACMQAGAIDYLDPASCSRLMLVLKREIARRGQRDEAEARAKRLEELLVRAQRQEALGRLAAGVAHELNNALTVILSFAGFVRDDLGAEDPRRKDIAEVLRAADRASVVARQMRSFWHQRPAAARSVNLNDVLASQEKLLHRLIGDRGRLICELDASLWPICIDPGHLEQLLVNLALNARDAIDPEGVIRVQTRNVAASSIAAAGCGDDLAAAAPWGQDHVVIEFADTGRSLTPEQQARAFDPIVNPQAGDSGLGLAVCRVIVRRAGGDVEVESPAAGGRVFRLAFPRSLGPSTTTRNVLAVGAPPRTETVLVAVPDRRIADLVGRILGSTGLKVLMAIDSEAALALTRQHRGAIALLVADVALPGLSARDLARELLPQRTDLGVVLLTDSTATDLRPDDLPSARTAVVLKPFSGNQLLAAAHRLLMGSSS